MHRHALKTALLSSTLMFMAAGSVSAADEDHISFKMVVSPGASTCLPDARAKVQLISDGQAEDMFIVAKGLPPNTGFDFFVSKCPMHRLGCPGIKEICNRTMMAMPSNTSGGALTSRRSSLLPASRTHRK